MLYIDRKIYIVVTKILTVKLLHITLTHLRSRFQNFGMEKGWNQVEILGKKFTVEASSIIPTESNATFGNIHITFFSS